MSLSPRLSPRRHSAVPLGLSLALAAGLLAGAGLASPTAQAETLTVYTYRSFVSSWGPGPQIKDAFEAECDCTLEWVAVDEGAGLLSRLRLEGDSSQADIVLGLDMTLVEEARDLGLLAPHGLDLSGLDLPVRWDDDIFAPYNWGMFAFVYNSEQVAEPPASLRALALDSDLEVVIQDPRTSTPGLGLMLWMRHAHGEEAADLWSALRPRIVTVTSGWSEAYGLFLEGEADMVLSYTTSPAYHRHAENDDRFEAAAFAEGHYLTVEVAAKLASSAQPDLARQFLEFMISPSFQDVIPTTNWMYPVRMPTDGMPDAFRGLVVPDQVRQFAPADIRQNRTAWIDEWLQAMSR